MDNLVLQLLFLGSVYRLEAHEPRQICHRLLGESKEGNGILMAPHGIKVDIDYLHRIRRNANESDQITVVKARRGKTNKDPGNLGKHAAQMNAKGPQMNATSNNRTRKYKVKVKNKNLTWSEDRKKERSEFMRKVWQNIKESGNNTKSRKQLSDTMKAHWATYREEKIIPEGLVEEYWQKRKAEEGPTKKEDTIEEYFRKEQAENKGKRMKSIFHSQEMETEEDFDKDMTSKEIEEMMSGV
ncbi:hypothetical protein WDU94_003256 [Cyamophila willieti]